LGYKKAEETADNLDKQSAKQKDNAKERQMNVTKAAKSGVHLVANSAFHLAVLLDPYLAGYLVASMDMMKDFPSAAL
jgi:hypothetical protein